MTDIAGFKTFQLQIDREGRFPQPQQRQQIVDFFAAGKATDLWLISHGWNNDMAEAAELYRNFLLEVRGLWQAGRAPGRQRDPVVVALYWPSKKFADKDLIPGQAAALQPSGAQALLAGCLRDLRGFFDQAGADDRLDELAALLPLLAGQQAARRRFGELVRDLPQVPAMPADGEEAATPFDTIDGATLMRRLEGAVSVGANVAKPGSGGAAVMPPSVPAPSAKASIPAAQGLATSLFGLGGAVGGAFSAAYNALNLVTYYQMKKRAGLLGAGPVAQLLRELAAADATLRIHLAGHSFGARLCTAAVLGEKGMPTLQAQSLTLLQAAFSHHGFAPKAAGRPQGAFRQVLTGQRIAGVGLVTHSKQDIPVGIAYPLASRLAGVVNSGLGDASSPYGGLGRNGAQQTPGVQAQVLSKVGAAYGFKPGTLTNLNADKTITGHSDICKDEVAYAFCCATDS